MRIRTVLSVIFLCLFSLCLDAQEKYNNFILDNGHLSWQKVFKHEAKDSAFVKTWFKSSFKTEELSDNHYLGIEHGAMLPYREVGYTKMNVIMTFTTPCNLKFDVEFKAGRYRVTVTDIEWLMQSTINGYSSGTKSLSIYKFAVSGDSFSNKFKGSFSEQLDKILTYHFTCRIPRKDNDNW